MPIGKTNKPRRYYVSRQTFLLIQKGEKDLYVLSEDPTFILSSVGDVIEFCSNTAGGLMLRCLRRIVARRRYAMMLEIPDHEDLRRLAHGDKTQTMSYLARHYRPDQEEGPASVLELEPLPAEEKK